MAEEETKPPPSAKKSGGKWYKEMIGPLPAGAWMAVVGGGLALSYWRKKHGVATTTPTATDTATEPMTDAGVGNLGLVGGTSTGTGPTGPGLQPITSNNDWYRQALAAVLSKGADPVLADRALRDYMEGNQLDQNEQAIIELALQLVGPMPTPPPPAAATPPIVQPPGTTGPPSSGTQPGTPNLTGMSNQNLLDAGNFLMEQRMGDAKPYADEAVRRLKAGTLSSNDPHWDMVPTFKAYVTRDFFGWLTIPAA